MHAAVEVAPLDAGAVYIEQGRERGDRLRRTGVLCRDPIDRRSQLAAFVVQLPGRAGPTQLDVDPTVPPPAQPCPETVRQALQRRPGLPVYVADDPLLCVVRGSGMSLEHLNRFSSLFVYE